MVDPIIFIIITILGIGLGIKVTSTQNPVYSGLYLVLTFFLGSGIAFLLGLEFIALLFLLVYAGAIAVLVLFVVMMLDVKAIENPWSAKKKRLLYIFSLFLFASLLLVSYSSDLLNLLKSFATTYIGSLVFFSLSTYEDYIKKNFQPVIITEIISDKLHKNEFFNKTNISKDVVIEEKKSMTHLLDERMNLWDDLCHSEGLTDFFQLLFNQDSVSLSYGNNSTWFIEFDSSCALNDPSYLLYSTYAILLIIAGVILLIAMVGAISLTLQKNCPESLYRQLGRESKNAVFSIKEKRSSQPIHEDNLEVLP
uniref:NADH dehydrogenase subunit 6 n=1 Tax=Hapterophycus canaliculatus TaxID=2567908 RepID=UPI002E77D85F|nr:NADH dehydrogenase subunit 6 [Hapterophycus canaliculatus]WBP70175.1 NADH dehydrogenase subunit 6 [Hapterophycus canaliculatus]